MSPESLVPCLLWGSRGRSPLVATRVTSEYPDASAATRPRKLAVVAQGAFESTVKHFALDVRPLRLPALPGLRLRAGDTWRPQKQEDRSHPTEVARALDPPPPLTIRSAREAGQSMEGVPDACTCRAMRGAVRCRGKPDRWLESGRGGGGE